MRVSSGARRLRAVSSQDNEKDALMPFAMNCFPRKTGFLSTCTECAVAVVLLAAVPAVAQQESNRDQVRANVASGGWNVVWGVTITEAEYAKASISISSGSYATYFDGLLQGNIDTFRAKAGGVAASAISEAIKRSFKGRGTMVRVGRIGVKAGVATYSRWQIVPMWVDSRWRSSTNPMPFWGPKPIGGYWKIVNKKVPLPSQYQPYVAFRLF
jgi:hypothetical protein